MVKARRPAGPVSGSEGASLEGWAKRAQQSREIAADRATKKRKQEGRALFEYEQLLKKEGIAPSEQFLKRKKAYQEKLQDEKDQVKRRQAKKRKMKEAAAVTEEGEDGEQDEKEDAASKALESKQNPFRKARKDFEDKDKKKKEARSRAEKEKEERLRQREQMHKERKQLNKRLRQKTKRGQPVMAHHMNYLMHKIEKSMGRT
eukprot:Hpha_TRINITY_DN16803_c1_g5::TRINITY_DN16803_c1_g5_i1::g.150566::m.150566